MKNLLLPLAVVLCLTALRTNAQVVDDSTMKFGIWNSLNDNLNQVYPRMSGTLKNFNWSDLETSPNVWNWVSFDSTLTASANINVPFVYMIYTKQNAPDWLYTNGVPKVIEKDAAGIVTGYAPYYANTTYKFYFKRMINLVRLHVESLAASVRNKAVGVQACFGSTGDYISYKGTVDPQYALTDVQFYNLFTEFSTYYYDEYKNTSPKIYIVNNPANDGQSETNWLVQNCPGFWLKEGSMGKGFQLNDEKSKSGWLYSILNTPQNGYNARSRSEITGGTTSTGWWLKQKYKNHFAMMCYDVYWGLDMPNMSEAELSNSLYDSSLSFFNKYAQNGNQKNPLLTKNAMCALKDGLDAADAVRFPAATYGTVDRNNIQRYQNIVNSYAAYGAKLEDLTVVSSPEGINETASGTNDAGWDLLPGNYERYIHQLTPNTTSVGYWNVQSSDTSTIYGRFARGFDVANGKDAMYFDVDSIFLNYAPLNGQYPVTIDVTYLDNGTGSWKIFYDAQSSSNKVLTNTTCTNTGLWKKASFLLSDAYFGNRGTSGSDFYIKSTNSENVIFSIVELSRPKSDQSDVGLFPTAVPSFDTVCLSSTAVAKSFTLGGQFLDGSNVVVGPLAGYSFANSSTGAYKDSLIINGYGTSINKTVYVKLSTASLGNYNGNISISGGGVASKNIVIPGSIVNTVPELSDLITNITCNGLKNGAIDLSLTGGTGPFTYNWTGAGSFTPTNQDITGLSATNYTVTVTSYAGCTTSASYTITQPAALTVAVTGDVMICKNGTTSVYVSAAGGTQPYTGTGTFSAPKGSSTYTVTDANGCISTKSYSVTNGTLVVPGTPGTITGSPDAASLCNGGNFDFSISAVTNATSYTWIAPPGSSIVSNGGVQVTLNKPAGALTDSIFVKANNSCGSSAAKGKSLTTVPSNTSAINGSATVAPSQAGLTYSVTAVSGLSYTWTVPEGAAIVSGQNTSSITVNWGILPGSVTVNAINNCSSSSVTSLSVGVIPGVFTSSLNTIPSFGTLCVNATSANNSITLTGSGLNGTDVVVGPLSGYVFSGVANGTYANTFVVSGYGTNISRSVFVKFNPSTIGSYNSSFPISGGGGTSINIAVSGTAVNSSPVLSVAITNLTCNASANGAVDLTTTGGTGPFTYSWTGPGSFSSINQDITALSASTYNVTVTSNAGCTVTGSYTVTEPDALTVTLAADNMICSNGTTIAYVTATGGTLPYTGIGNFSAPSGSNTFNVTDANGCLKSKSIFITNGTGVAPAKPVTINSSDADATGLCGGGNFIFSIDTVTTATSYTWTTPAGCSIVSTTGNGTQITMAAPANFSTGTLSVTANNVCGSSLAKTKTLSNVPGTPGPITGPTSITASQTGLIYNIPTVPGVTYTWTAAASGASILSGLYTPEVSVKWGTASGKMKVSVSNSCGSSALATLNINIVTVPTLYASTTAVPTFGSLCVNSSATKSFNIYGTLLNGSNIIVGSVSGYKYSTSSNGTYTSTLTLSGYGSSISQAVYVKFSPTSAVAYNGNIPVSGGGGTSFNVGVSGTGVNSNPVLSTAITNVACYGGLTGAVNLTATGGTGPFAFSWSGTSFSSSAEDITGLAPGSYSVVVTALGGCTVSTSAAITQPALLSATASSGLILCNGGTTTVNVSAAGGTLPYNGTGTFTAGAGNYNYTVTDAYGCSTITSVSVTQPSVFSASATAGTILCNGATTNVLVGATGGTLPYTGTGTFAVGAGSYSYLVSDANGCAITKTITITQPSALNVSASAGPTSLDGTAVVTVTASGGVSPYSGTGTFTVTPGTYTYTVRDNNGCAATASVTVSSATSLIASASAGIILCNGGTTSVNVSATGGVSPYTGTGIFTVAAGTYTYTVTDAHGFTAGTSVTITQPQALSASASSGSILCNGGATTVNVTATGGTLPYTGTGIFTALAGNYNYTVTDANGCSSVKSVSIIQPSLISITVNAGTILCNGGATNVSVNATGGTAPYSGTGIFTVGSGSYNYIVSDANSCSSTKSVTIAQPSPLSVSASAGPTSLEGTALVTVSASGGVPPYTGVGTFTVTPGTYVYGVSDANGCSSTASVTVNPATPLTASATAGSILCRGGTTTVSVNANGGVGPYTGTGIFTVTAGTYTYTVTDAHGFTATASVTVSEPEQLNASASTGAILCSGATTNVTVTASGGIAPYNGTGIFAVGAGTYNYTVTDANGCSASKSVTVSQPAILSVSLSSGSILCNGGSTNVVVSAVGGTMPYTGTGTFAAGAGTPAYTVTDANGCTSNKSISITQPSAIVVSASAGTVTCVGGTTTVSVSASGGVLPYTGTGNFSASAGTINYSVTDGNGCQASKSINIANGTQLAPPQPGGIISPTADSTGLCGGGGFSYDIALVNTATSYTWTTPAGCTIGYVAPDGTDILLNVPTGFVSGPLSVTANNVCGNSAASVKVITALPVQPSAISGLTTVTSLQSALTYSVSAIPGLTYTWTVPSGAVINSGQNTSSVKVKWSDVTGVISCQAVNACGASAASSLTVTVSGALLSSSVSSLPAFQTVCVNGASNIQAFTITGTDLNLSEVVVGPLPGFKFQTGASQIYYDSLLINNGSTGLTKSINVKFTPTAVGTYNTSIPVRGGGANPIGIAVTATAVNSSPGLSAIITNITCNGSKNGAIDLSTTGGTGPFTYAWTGTGTYDPTAQDISGLSPVDYSVTVTSFAGCTTSATYPVIQPAALTVSLSNDIMVCKNTSTNVYVSATGGTLPYSGVGTFTAANGFSSYTVTDANGCTKTGNITVANGLNDVPAKPGTISSTSDAAGLCGGGSFVFTIDAVATATSYTWLPPTGGTITATANGGAQATLSVPSNFSADSISVKANNICGSSAFKVKQLTAIAALPAGISGPVTALPSQTGIVYTVVSPTPGLSYTWTVPGAATITAGQNTSSITAKWGITTGNVTVKSVNNCGSSLATTLSVSVVGGVFTVSPSPLPAFDTVCVNGLSTSKSFSLSAAGLNGNNVTIGPRTGYVFSSTNAGTYTSSLTISGYGTTINQNVFVKFNPATVGSFNGNVSISGGGATASSIGVSGVAVNSSPSLSAVITNITCNGSKNGAIDLSITGGTAPFTYAWTGAGTYDPTMQDISGLSPVNYMVTVTSYAGCTTSATYPVTEPAVLAVTLTNDVMVCKNTTTNVFVTASGGTAPYTGTGTFTAPSGLSSYTVTDAKGCVKTGSITVPNGTGVAPAAPSVINGAAADAKGLCGGGNFVYSVDPVSTATSYTWTAPAGCTVGSPNNATQITMTAPANFSTGTLSVTANNGCGVSPATSKSLSNIPGKPDVITGPITVTAQQSGLVYSVPAVAGVTYTWTVPGTGTITSGSGTSSITVKWGNITGNVTCKAGNSCGTSAARTLSVTVSAVFAAQQFDESVYTTLSSDLSVAPNPAKDYANVSFKAEGANKYTLLLTDLTGKLVNRTEGTSVKGINRVKLNVYAYANGTYILTLVDQRGKRTTLKLVKE